MKILAIFTILLSVGASALTIEPAEKPKGVIVCPSAINMVAKKAPDPVVRVAPVFPQHAKEDQACVVVSFSLKAKKGTEGKALVPVKVKAEAYSSKRFVKSSVNAVSKWLYLSEGVDPKERYYVEIKYALE